MESQLNESQAKETMNTLTEVQSAPLTEEQIHGIARVCHEANRTYCLLLDDDSQVTWEQAPDWQKASAVEGVKRHMQNPHKLHDGAWSHENWMEQKLRDGWRWGPVKDAEKKEHPCLLPYRMLPETEKTKDTLFAVIAHIITNALDPHLQVRGKLGELRKDN